MKGFITLYAIIFSCFNGVVTMIAAAVCGNFWPLAICVSSSLTLAALSVWTIKHIK